MEIIIFILLAAICMGLIYIVHKYFGKVEFYLLSIIYSIIAFLMSFKMINIFGIDINGSIIFTSGLLMILYYFIKRYSEKEYKRFIVLSSVSTLTCIIILLLSAFMIPSIHDKTAILYQNLVFNNLAIIILYPIANIITLVLSSYCFNELKKEKNYELGKTLATITGIIFIDVLIFVYFSYAILIKFDTSIIITLDNYLIKTIIMVIYTLIVNKLFMVRKVK
ncbi:MAG: hypothetical protein IJZ46_03615 [Bacilli bacterium]|nr:hypothetical protein [Bacilli bacterium]